MAEERRSHARKPSTASTRRTSSSRGPEHGARPACRSLEGLIDHPTEGVSAVKRQDDG